MGKNKLAPGFRFHPTDIELVMHYLKRKVTGKKLVFNGIAKVDIYKHDPCDLPNMSSLHTDDLKWFFYCPMEKKYGRGARLNRATLSGYWKTTGKDRDVRYKDDVVGKKKTLVFHGGKPPKGVRTDWVMHEYRLEERRLAERGVVQDTYTLCVVFKKDGLGPKNGFQYGAPFKEDDWSDDDDDEEEEEKKKAHLPGSGMTPTIDVGGGSESTFESSGPHHDGSVVDVNVVTTDITCGLLESPDYEVAEYEEWNDNSLSMLLDLTEQDTDIVTHEGDQMEATDYNSGTPLVYEEDDISYLLNSFNELDNFSGSL